MRKTVIVILIVFFMISYLSGQSFFWITGVNWNEWKYEEQMMYLIGVLDGFVFADFIIQGVRINTDIEIEQYKKAVDDFYSDVGNVLIPVPFIFKIIALKINGESQDKIEAEILKMRKQFSKKIISSRGV